MINFNIFNGCGLYLLLKEGDDVAALVWFEEDITQQTTLEDYERFSRKPLEAVFLSDEYRCPQNLHLGFFRDGYKIPDDYSYIEVMEICLKLRDYWKICSHFREALNQPKGEK